MNENTSTLDAATRRRQNFFLGTKRADDFIEHERSEQHTASDDPASARAELHLREAITSIAQSIGIAALPSGAVDAMVQRATPALRSMSRQQLMALSPSSGLLQALAATTFNPAMTPEAAQRLRLEQIKASYHGTGTTMTDAQILGLVQPPRLGGRSDIFSSNGSTGGTGSSGARYADMSANGVSFQMTPQMYYARTEAVRLGVPWVGNTPELLRLGTPAVRAIADVNLQQQSYQRLTKEAHFAARDVVTFAHYAKSKGITDANQAAGTVADFVRLGQDHAEQLRLKDSVTGFMAASNHAGAAPTDPAAQQRLQQAGETYKAAATTIAARSPEAAETTRRMEEANRIPEIYRAANTREATATATVEAAATRTATAETAADDIYAQAAAPTPAKAAATPAATPAAAAPPAPATPKTTPAAAPK